MAIVAGFDVHRAQITFDALNRRRASPSRPHPGHAGGGAALGRPLPGPADRRGGRGLHGLAVRVRGAARGGRGRAPGRDGRDARAAAASGAPRPTARTRAGSLRPVALTCISASAERLSGTAFPDSHPQEQHCGGPRFRGLRTPCPRPTGRVVPTMRSLASVGMRLCCAPRLSATAPCLGRAPGTVEAPDRSARVRPPTAPCHCALSFAGAGTGPSLSWTSHADRRSWAIALFRRAEARTAIVRCALRSLGHPSPIARTDNERTGGHDGYERGPFRCCGAFRGGARGAPPLGRPVRRRGRLA
jgi:hypothetical protein